MASAVDRWLAGTLRAVLKRVDSLESRAAGLEKTCGALLAAPAPGVREALPAPQPASAFVPHGPYGDKVWDGDEVFHRRSLSPAVGSIPGTAR